MGRDKFHNSVADFAQQWIFPSEIRLPFSPWLSGFDARSFAEQLGSDFFVHRFHPAGNQPIVPDDVKIVRRNVTDQLSEEFDGLQSVEAFATTIQIIFELEGDHVTSVISDP